MIRCSAPSAGAPTTTLSLLNADRRLLPSLQSERTKLLLLCRRIAHVKVSASVTVDGAACYTLEMFNRKPTSNIPTRRQHDRCHMGSYSMPDRVMYQRFSAFVGLSYELGYHARADHGSKSCDFCKALGRTIRRERPRLRTKLFHGEVAVQKELECFINATLTLVQDMLYASPDTCCDGQHEAPILLARFLTEKFDPLNVYDKK